MTFDPNFAFYSDDRRLNATIDDADPFWSAMKEEAGRLYTSRVESFPGRVAKGRMSRTDADREIRIARAIAEGWGAVQRSPDAPIATVVEILHGLRREIHLRRQRWPRLVEQHRITAEEMERRILVLEICHDVMWHGSTAPEMLAARADLDRYHQQQALKQAA